MCTSCQKVPYQSAARASRRSKPDTLGSTGKSATGKPGPATKEQFSSVCKVTGRPGNPRVTCCLDSVSTAHYWRYHVCVHVKGTTYPPVECGYRPWGVVCPGASSWEELWSLSQLLDSWSQKLNSTSRNYQGRFYHGIYVYFSLTGLSWSGREGNRIRLFVLCLHDCCVFSACEVSHAQVCAHK